jgi:hypothetical protein
MRNKENLQGLSSWRPGHQQLSGISHCKWELPGDPRGKHLHTPTPQKENKCKAGTIPSLSNVRGLTRTLLADPREQRSALLHVTIANRELAGEPHAISLLTLKPTLKKKINRTQKFLYSVEGRHYRGRFCGSVWCNGEGCRWVEVVISNEELPATVVDIANR